MPKVVDHEARRWQICEAAARLIAEGGLEAATIREIAQASGHSKGVVEHYFDGKGELISGALDWANRCYEQRVQRATRGLSGMSCLEKQVQAILPLDKSVRDEWKVRLVFWSMAAIDDRLRKRQEARFEAAVEHFQRSIEQAVAAGELADDADLPLLARRMLNVTAGISIAALHNRRLYTRRFLLAESDSLLAQLRREAAVSEQ